MPCKVLAVAAWGLSGRAMKKRTHLARLHDWVLIQADLFGPDGEVCETRFELSGPGGLTFETRPEAEAALGRMASLTPPGSPSPIGPLAGRRI
ncbi:hypothetical protein IP78_13710 [Brevundimonas sp. AAP58]|nr:hypothetical protein IP78_13710 [Brevundimonas sp. AAP58]